MQHNQHERDLNIKERTNIRCKEQLGTSNFKEEQGKTSIKEKNKWYMKNKKAI